MLVLSQYNEENVPVDEFTGLVSNVISQWPAPVFQKMMAVVVDEGEPPLVNFDMLSKFVDLFQYIPTNTKGRKDRNYSPQMYQALT